MPLVDPPSLAGDEFMLVHAASQHALEAHSFNTWPGDKLGNGKSSWNGAPFSNKSDTAEFTSLTPVQRASRFCWSSKGDTIHLATQPRLGFEATFREFDFPGNRVMLWGPHHYDVNWYCSFRVNGDNTVSPRTTSKNLVLGFGKCLQQKHGFHGDRDQCILVPHDDPRQLVVQPVQSFSAGSSSAAPVPVVMGTVVMEAPPPMGTAVPEASPPLGKGKAPMTLIEQVEVLKQQLGLKGGVLRDVVQQAAQELGVATEGKPIIAIVAECMQLLGC